MNNINKVILLLVTLVFGSYSQIVSASLGGTFTGTIDGQFTCDGITTIPFSGATITIDATSGPPINIINSFSITHPDFTYSASGTASEIGANQFGIGVAGTVNITGGSLSSFSGSGSLNGGVTADLLPDGSLSLDFGAYTGTNTSCTSSLVLFTDPATLSGSSGFTQVNPAITPGSIITTPATLNTEVRAITTDIQQRINDVMRNILLARQQREDLGTGTRPGSRPEGRPGTGPETGPEPMPAPVPRDRDQDDEEEDDDQAALPTVSPTATGFMVSNLTGVNAGDMGYPLGTWASYSYTDFENDFAPTAFDGRRHGGLVGLDASPWGDRVLVGLAVGYEDTDIDTDFNLGNQQTDGFTIAPYVGMLLTDHWSLSASLGYSNLETEQYRTLPGTTTRVTSSPDHDRWFAMVNLNGLTTYGNWVLGGQLGFLYARDSQDDFVESDGTAVAELDSRLGQFNIGGEAAYSMGRYEPFARMSYEYDFNQTEIGVLGGPQPSFDEDNVLLGFGLRYFGDSGWSGNVEFDTRLGREDYDEYNLTATLRYEW